MGSFDNTGYIRERLDAHLANLTAEYKVIFGDNIDLSPDSQDGQLVGIFAAALADLDQLGEAVFTAQNPNTSFASALESLVQLNGITKNQATNSTVTLTLTGLQFTSIPAGSEVSTVDTGEVFTTDTDVEIPISGTITVEATAVSEGPIAGLSGTLTSISTPIAGWNAANNVSDAALGEAEENDAQLRVRRANSVALVATNTVDGIHASILALDNVVAARVVENDTNLVDANGISPHSIHCVVQGGTDADIGQTIWDNKTGGTGTFGSTTVIVADSQGTNHSILMDRPTDIPIYITVNTTALPNFPDGGATLIQEAILEYFTVTPATAITIGTDVIYSQIYVPAAGSVVGHSISSLYVDVTGTPVATSDITIAYDELATFELANIIVNVT